MLAEIQRQLLEQEVNTRLVPLAHLPSSLQFASAVMMFGALLRKSRFVKDVGWNDVLQLATASADAASFSQKEFLSLVQHAKNLYGKKRKKEE